MIQDIDKRLKDLRGILGEKADRLKMLYLSETEPDAKRMLESQINLLHFRNLNEDNINLLPPPASVAQGEYPLGMVQFNDKNLYPFGLRASELPQHVIIAGRSGSGKSNTMLLLTKQFIDKQKPFLLFSFKREYRDLLADNPNLHVFTCGRDSAPFHFNPLIIPKGTDKETWINLLAEAISSCYFLGEGCVSLLRKGLLQVYATHSKPKIIHLREWLEDIQKAQRRESDWLASTKRAIDAMCFGSLGKTLNSDFPIDIETLLDKQVILELDNFNDDDRTFVIQCIMRWLYRYALENFPRNECKYVLMIDEAHHVFLKKASDLRGQETYSDAILRMVRECSLSIVLADQHPSLISLPAMGNTFTTIGMNLKTRADVLAIGNAMLLSDDQKEYLGKLPVGMAIVKLQDRFVEPFLIKVPRVSIQKGAVTDEYLSTNMKSRIEQLQTDFRDSVDGTPTPGGVPQIPASEEVAPPDPVVPVESGHALTEIERAFIVHVFEHPFTGTSARYRQLQLSTRHGTEIKDSLTGQGYLIPVDIHVYQNRMVLFELTDKSNIYLASLGYHRIKQPREGGVEHRYGVFNAKRFFQDLGYTTATEVRTEEGKFVDLVASRADESIANEIETGSSDIVENVRSAFAGGYRTVYVIATNIEAQQKAMRLLVDYPVPTECKLEICYLLPHLESNPTVQDIHSHTQ